jgi:glyoxylase-like metal-dependent hydrolase (beta-lactamase superfamily II)
MPADVIKIGPLGPYANNAYIIADPATKHAVFVDAPIGSEAAIDAAQPYDVKMIVVTHRHGDHWANIDLVKERLGAPVLCHEGDRAPYAAKVSDTVDGGATLTFGESSLRVIHTPGHTPGSICLLVETNAGDDVLISGDTLFPGGPGRSDSPAALQEMIGSITSKLLTLPDATAVYPGHGDNTTIADAKREYAVFASKPHADGLCGDVNWETS